MKRIILGTGPIGMAMMESETAKGAQVVLVNRKGFVREELPEGVTIQGLDISDSAALTMLLEGADCVFHCAGAPVEQWASALPPMMDSLIKAASASSVPLIYIDTLHAYGDAHGIPISESSPERAGFPAAEVRKSLGRQLLDAHFSKRLKAVIARSSEVYGPRVLEGPLGRNIFANLLDNKAAIIPGDLDLPHSYGYVRDSVRNAGILADNPESFGKVWHLPCSNAITQRQIFDILRDMLSRNPEIKTYTGKSGFLGLFNDVPLAMRDFMYQYNNPFVSNHTRFATTWGERCTPHPQALWETLEWYRRNGLGA